MPSVSVSVRYRPVRIGWCVDGDNIDAVRMALRLSHAFWGGRFNPVLPCNNPDLASTLVSAFRVDVLYNVTSTQAVDAFMKRFPYLLWPEFQPELFVEGPSYKRAAFLGITHPVRQLHEDYIQDRAEPKLHAVLYTWSDDDPLSDALLAICGAYPAEAAVGRDYAALYQKGLSAQQIRLVAKEPLPVDLFREFTPSVLTAHNLEPDLYSGGFSSWSEPGFYVGRAGDVVDLLNFWNLRAADIDLMFYDSEHAERLTELTAAFSTILQRRPKDRLGWQSRINVWRKSQDEQVDPKTFGGQAVSLCTFDAGLFNGLNLNPPSMGFESQNVLGSLDEHAVAFSLPKKPFFSDMEQWHQKVVVSTTISAWGHDKVFSPPYLPQLNEYYGREIHFDYNKVRSEPRGIGVISDVNGDHLTLRGVAPSQLIAKVFEAFGMTAKPSAAGLVTGQLIKQMGDLQDCRVFKIRGVRELIRKYAPWESFDRSEAIRVIGSADPTTGRPRFEDYHSLYIEYRENRDLKPEDAFLFLLKRGVFRAGLTFTCPSCQLDFWVHLDAARSRTECEWCGKEFNVLPQLRDRSWFYRRSGLFGRGKGLEGGIPVALTLQQLDTALHGRDRIVYVTGTEISPAGAAVEKCESDFIVAVEDVRPPVQIALGECKDQGGEITEEDVAKLAAVANAFDPKWCKVFVIFAKAGEFTDAEIERCAKAQRFERDGRVILLSARELEPYFIYERAEKEFNISRSAICLEDMGVNTQNIFFKPRPKTASH